MYLQDVTCEIPSTVTLDCIHVTRETEFGVLFSMLWATLIR